MAQNHNYYVYIMMSISEVLYIGVTNNLERRVDEHQNGLVDGFTKKYNCKKLVYFEQYGNIDEAIRREKQLKNWKREWKMDLIQKTNPNFDDISLQYKSPDKQILNQVQSSHWTRFSDDNAARALYIGRFQPFHLGHLYALSQIREPEIIIGIGSAQYSRTEDNPYTFEERKRMIEEVLEEGQATILAIPDIHDEEKWVEHVLDITGPIDVVYTGNAWVKELFGKEGQHVQDLIIKNPYSGTTIRRLIREDSPAWKEMLPEHIAEIIEKINTTL